MEAVDDDGKTEVKDGVYRHDEADSASKDN